MHFAVFPNIILIYRMVLIYSLMQYNYNPLPIPRRQEGRWQYVWHKSKDLWMGFSNVQ